MAKGVSSKDSSTISVVSGAQENILLPPIATPSIRQETDRENQRGSRRLLGQKQQANPPSSDAQARQGSDADSTESMKQQIDFAPTSPSSPSPFNLATVGSRLFREGFVPPTMDDQIPKVSGHSFEPVDHVSHEQSNWKAWFDASLPDNRLPPNEPLSAGMTTPTIRVASSQQPYTPDPQAQPQDYQNTPAAALDAQHNFSHATMAGQYSSYAYPYSLEMENGGEEELALAMADEDEGPASPPIGPSTKTVSPAADTQSLTRPLSPIHTSTTPHAPYTYAYNPFVEQGSSSFDQPFSKEAVLEMADVCVAPETGSMTGIASPISSRSRSSSDMPGPPPKKKMRPFSANHRSFSMMVEEPLPQPPMQMQFDHTERSRSQLPANQTYSMDSTEVAQGYKRRRNIKHGDPPQAHDGKYYCNFAPECAGEYFDRTCEWSEHMNKHDRPYRCHQPECAQIQGFRYAKDLSRHQSRVHGKHRDPWEQFRCTIPECKRHQGRGFIRKDNLNEHLCRVHGITASDASHPPVSQQQSPEAGTSAAPVGTESFGEYPHWVGGERGMKPDAGGSPTHVPVEPFSGAHDTMMASTSARNHEAFGTPNSAIAIARRNKRWRVEARMDKPAPEGPAKDESPRKMDNNPSLHEPRLGNRKKPLAPLPFENMDQKSERTAFSPFLTPGDKFESAKYAGPDVDTRDEDFLPVLQDTHSLSEHKTLEGLSTFQDLVSRWLGGSANKVISLDME